jgi:hypothetical protein
MNHTSATSNRTTTIGKAILTTVWVDFTADSILQMLFEQLSVQHLAEG